jgi:uncharacterized protein YbjQ (UPF0145 family)
MFEGKRRDGRHEALQMLRIPAVEPAANTIITIDFDYPPISLKIRTLSEMLDRQKQR